MLLILPNSVKFMFFSILTTRIINDEWWDIYWPNSNNFNDPFGPFWETNKWTAHNSCLLSIRYFLFVKELIEFQALSFSSIFTAGHHKPSFIFYRTLSPLTIRTLSAPFSPIHSHSPIWSIPSGAPSLLSSPDCAILHTLTPSDLVSTRWVAFPLPSFLSLPLSNTRRFPARWVRMAGVSHKGDGHMRYRWIREGRLDQREGGRLERDDSDNWWTESVKMRMDKYSNWVLWHSQGVLVH